MKILVFILLYSSLLHSQDTTSSYPVLTDSVINKGIYLSFTDFKNNEASITNVDFNKKYTIYNKKIVYKDTLGEKIKLKDWWSIYDGKKFSIKTGYGVGEIVLFGKYSIIEVKKEYHFTTDSYTTVTTSTETFVLDFSCGMKFRLTKDFVYDILDDYPELNIQKCKRKEMQGIIEKINDIDNK